MKFVFASLPNCVALEAVAALPVQEAELPPALPVILPVIVFATVSPTKLLVLFGSK